MNRFLGSPSLARVRQLETELLGHASVAPERHQMQPCQALLSFYQVTGDRYGRIACQRLVSIKAVPATGGAPAPRQAGVRQQVLARLLHRNAMYHARVLCRQQLKERLVAVLPAQLRDESGAGHWQPDHDSVLLLQSLAQAAGLDKALLPAPDAPVREFVRAAVLALLTLEGKNHRLGRPVADAAGAVLISHWLDVLGHRLAAVTIVASANAVLHELHTLSLTMLASAPLLEQSVPDRDIIRLARSLQGAARLALRHRDTQVQDSLALVLRAALVLQARLSVEDDIDVRPAVAITHARVRVLRSTLRARFRQRSDALPAMLNDIAQKERAVCIAAVQRLVSPVIGCHVGNNACTASCKLAMNRYTSGDHKGYLLAESLRVVLALALQQHMRVEGMLAACVSDACEVLSKPEHSPGLTGATDALMVLESQLSTRLARLAGSRVLVDEGDSLALPDQLAAGLKQLPAADRRLATAAVDPVWLSAIMNELEMLASGARRMKVYRVASMASALLLVYRRVAGGAVISHWTVAERKFLQRAHHRLKRMLDQAAAWQTVTPAPTLINQLHDCLLAQTPDAALSPSRASGPGSKNPIRQTTPVYRRIRQGLKVCAMAAGRGEDTSGELLMLLDMWPDTESDDRDVF